MKNRLLRKLAACLLAACLCGALLSGCKSAPATQVDITCFRFVDSDGWTMPDQYTIEEGREGLIYLSWQPAYLEEPRQTLMTQPLQSELWALLQRHEIGRWDGFEKSLDAFDAPGFYLRIEFADGNRMEAHGYGKFPQGYASARDDFAAFFETASLQDKYL